MHMEDGAEDHYLILGGNGFIGFETVCCILSKYATTERACCITLANRGRSWDWDKREILKAKVEKSGPSAVRMIHIDRKQPLANCPELLRSVSSVQRFRAVIDFSAYKPFTLKDSIKLLGEKCHIYIFISTDSVYEVCVRKLHSRGSEEADAVRPSSAKEQKILKSLDRYGHYKLKCEELLKYQSQHFSNVSHVIFRLVDVIGGRDSTNRLWKYILWIMLCCRHNLPIYLPESSRCRQLSLCYVQDVASLLANLCFAGDKDKLMICKNDCFNLASAESITIEQLLNTVHSELKLTGHLTIHYCDGADMECILPSVTRGPVDITKAVTLIDWNPTPVLEAVKCSVAFYVHIMSCCGFQSEKKICMRELLHDLKDYYSKLVRHKLRKTLKELLNLKIQ